MYSVQSVSTFALIEPILALQFALAPEIYPNTTLFVEIWHIEGEVVTVEDTEEFTCTHVQNVMVVPETVKGVAKYVVLAAT